MADIKDPDIEALDEGIASSPQENLVVGEHPSEAFSRILQEQTGGFTPDTSIPTVPTGAPVGYPQEVNAYPSNVAPVSSIPPPMGSELNLFEKIKAIGSLPEQLGSATRESIEENVGIRDNRPGAVFPKMLEPVRGATPAAPALADSASLENVLGQTTSAITPIIGQDSTVSYAPSPKVDALQAHQRGLVDKVDKSTKDLTDALDQANQDAEVVQGQRLIAQVDHATKAKDRQSMIEKAYSDARSDIDALKNEMANTDWSSYWDSRTTGDKLLLALSVGLGAYGQTTIGGKNIGMEVLNNLTKEHDNIRKEKFNQLKDRLVASGDDSIRILEGTKRLSDMDSAAHLADLAVFKSQTDRIAERAKTPELKNAAILKSAEFDAEITNREIQQADATRTKVTATRDIYGPTANRNISPNAQYYIDPNTGKKVMREGEVAKAAMAAGTLLHAELAARPQEDNLVTESPEYEYIYDTLNTSLQGMTGDLIMNMQAISRMGPELLRAAGKNEGARIYAQSIIDQANAYVRNLSGASMPVQELVTHIQSTTPLPLSFYNGNVKEHRRGVAAARIKREQHIEGVKAKAHIENPSFYQPGFIPSTASDGSAQWK